MAKLIFGCRLFIQLKSSFSFWELWVHIPKISSRYHYHRKHLNSLFQKIIFSNPVINKLEYGAANLFPVANLFFDGTLTTHSQNNDSSK